MKNITVYLKGNEITVEGELTQDTVMLALEKCKSFLPHKQAIDINLKNASNCDSASLAFLTALFREGVANETKITFLNLPAQMHQLAKVSGLDLILPALLTPP